MVFDDPFVFTLLLSGLIFYAAGKIMLMHPPKKISHLYGYRTPGSMKSQERWDFAQGYSSRLSMNLGAAMVVLAALGYFFDIPEKNGALASTGIVVAAAIYLIAKTEFAMNRKFPD